MHAFYNCDCIPYLFSIPKNTLTNLNAFTKVQILSNEITSSNSPVLMHYGLAFLMKLRSELSTNQSVTTLYSAII
jgi:hypothetical protein